MADPLASLSAVVVPRGDADLDERERFLDSLTRLPLPRSFVFATCHRVELYAVDQTTLPRARGSRLLRGTEAARHLFRVAAGLESLVAGEVQILGQLRRVRGSVRGEPLLEALIERALRLGRDVRAGTALGSMTRSLGSLAVDEALRFVDRPAEATALVVGAGEMGKLASRALRHRVRTLLVANRDAARAAVRVGGRAARGTPGAGERGGGGPRGAPATGGGARLSPPPPPRLPRPPGRPPPPPPRGGPPPPAGCPGWRPLRGDPHRPARR